MKPEAFSDAECLVAHLLVCGHAKLQPVSFTGAARAIFEVPCPNIEQLSHVKACDLEAHRRIAKSGTFSRAATAAAFLHVTVHDNPAAAVREAHSLGLRVTFHDDGEGGTTTLGISADQRDAVLEWHRRAPGYVLRVLERLP